MEQGRPTKYKPEFDELVYKYCLLGATDEELATFLDVDVATVNRWKSTHPSFCESIKKGKEVADSEVAAKLFHRATGYSCPDIITATFEGKITDIQEVVKHYPPDTTAAIFWLKNRQSGKWRDKQVLDTTTELTVKGDPFKQIRENYNITDETNG